MKTLKVILAVLNFFLAAQAYSQTFQWRVLPNSPGPTTLGRFEDLHFINPNTGWVVGYLGQVYRTTNGGLKFDTVFTSVAGNKLRSVGFFDANTGLFGTLIDDTAKILYRTTNGGFNWTAVNIIAGLRPEGICGISIVNENVAYACGRYYSSARIIKTSDKGISWSLVFNDTAQARSLVDCYFWTADSGIAVGGYNTSSFENGNAVVLRTTNGGTSWERVHKTTRTGEWCWKISFISRDIGFVSIESILGSSYILKTTNNGTNWIEIPIAYSQEQGIGFVNENTGWVGGWSGPTYQTTNGGANWQLAGWGSYLNRFRFLSDTLAYAVGDRVYRYSRESVGINLISSVVPSSFQLHQNYPNPFNPNTVIRYSLIENRFVTLKVYDALGNEVATLVNEKQNRGSYSYQFSTANYQLSSGIYFYKLNAGNFSEVKRMILLK